MQIRTAVNRIEETARNLLAQNRIKSSISSENDALYSSLGDAGIKNMSTEIIALVVDSSLDEMRAQFGNDSSLSITARYHDNYRSCSEIERNAFVTIISNIIRNSSESSARRVEIELYFLEDSRSNLLVIRDDGKGIPQDQLVQLGQKGKTFGKASGSGLGLYHAKSTIESWGGSLKISSEVGQGTTVEIGLPLSNYPSWLAIEISLLDVVLVVDDDPTIHFAWKQKIAGLKIQCDLFHCNSLVEALDWYRSNLHLIQNTTFLIDYDFKFEDRTGLDFISMTGVEKNSFLVTSQFNEVLLRVRSEKMGVKILPKPLLGDLRISRSN
jgi:hypothetical protein